MFGNSTNGTTYTERMRIDSSGRVGIGTTSPSGKLEIAATGTNAAPHIKLVESGDTREFNIYNDGSGNGRLVLADTDDTPDTEIVLADNGIIQFKTANSERMRIDSSGNVKINNTRTTAVPLQVVGGTASGTMYDVAVFAGGQNSTQGSGAKIYLSGCENDPISRGTIIEGQMTDNGNSHALIFHTSGNSQTPAERMRIDASGTVLFKSGSFPTNQDSPFIYRIGGGSLAIGAATETGTSAHAAFYTNSLERMRIDSSGNLLVSKTSSI